MDGFNPCAMWVLFFLINLLLGMGDRKKMWILGGAFIHRLGRRLLPVDDRLAEYPDFFWIYFLDPDHYRPGGPVRRGLQSERILDRHLRDVYAERGGPPPANHGADQGVIQTRKFWLGLIGIVLLAFMVNLVELICSAGFPVVYLQILSLTPLPFWQYYLYILLYIAIFMLDDIVVFVVP